MDRICALGIIFLSVTIYKTVLRVVSLKKTQILGYGAPRIGDLNQGVIFLEIGRLNSTVFPVGK